MKDGANLGNVQAKLQALLGSGFQVQEPSARAQQFDSISRVYTLTANVSSVFALFIGMFIIYNTFQIAVTQRRAEIGILRALGATRRQIRTLFLGESVVAGLFGSILGLLVGIAIARGMTGYIGSLLGEIYGIAQKAGENDQLFGSVTAGDIATALEKLGYNVDRRKVHLEEPIKQLGDHKATVRLHRDVYRLGH